MPSFTRDDYKQLFAFGRELYNIDGPARRREIAVTLMAMAEDCIGQQVSWPIINRRYEHLRHGQQEYNNKTQTRNVVILSETNPDGELTAAQRQSIRNDPRLYREIAADYNISQTSVSRIKNRARWADLS